jgi:hypothetical protein
MFAHVAQQLIFMENGNGIGMSAKSLHRNPAELKLSSIKIQQFSQ